MKTKPNEHSQRHTANTITSRKSSAIQVGDGNSSIETNINRRDNDGVRNSTGVARGDEERGEEKEEEILLEDNEFSVPLAVKFKFDGNKDFTGVRLEGEVHPTYQHSLGLRVVKCGDRWEARFTNDKGDIKIKLDIDASTVRLVVAS